MSEPGRGRARPSLRSLRLWASLVTGLLLPACSAFGAPAGGTRQGEDINDLWRIFFVAGLVIGGTVIALILWCVVRYRRREGDAELPPQTGAYVPVEVVYTVLPVAVVVALFALTLTSEHRVEELSPNPSVTIRVTGFQWQWRFDYVGEDVTILGTDEQQPQMVLPMGETVRIQLFASDVIHSFYVPGFLFKRDAIPGRMTQFDVRADRPGTYRGECAEYCGLDHAYMSFTVRVVSPEAYDAWLASNRQQVPVPVASTPAA
jgi:cytochrome c oxidase subunit 2